MLPSLRTLQAGKLAAKEVSAVFPRPMELKFERVCQPLMLLHVNRWGWVSLVQYSNRQLFARGSGEYVMIRFPTA